MKVIRISYSL